MAIKGQAQLAAARLRLAAKQLQAHQLLHPDLQPQQQARPRGVSTQVEEQLRSAAAKAAQDKFAEWPRGQGSSKRRRGPGAAESGAGARPGDKQAREGAGGGGVNVTVTAEAIGRAKETVKGYPASEAFAQMLALEAIAEVEAKGKLAEEA